ncbi:MAG: hypothetical protein A2725_00195 [Candidatus Magasanikbacteria bacterium RIFCSPHIGHO2_01_FULL_33_34]|uniref:Glycosyltransferase RgtA/B/C/D-like domain-containing protein n=1 Tax=Candidatus Magasanikbacteria bacterium RIFCSPHIGHO2_01_FULL_33_34 TaxID=1798671 RepID=A0A1F6LKY8_9BACT|nr:MAG: hypothetical protein A2725_00195 [Candidatus Magasanikbacteria bacterium RIFCSPHIGHO2_01_FULL_33_34]OGH65781.1 MAG: hypothetical protein A3B83_02865 [Candidatus Magasanikbacteria bacterium RIFCSPHIGHO2_02_FULL_33_17]OGH75146.1 MAG: hypothetical protein A3A89_03460 [Candidatus Magasanikbacteria bacterium RIFCSPLOWO2_01_FULL_33_34]OGH81224.1 MAG: hypothetical protein A3F93_04160 [Candidatus Magasanikbacteria bacterium RIFCSPLOWO2_12_FULL_34_7]
MQNIKNKQSLFFGSLLGAVLLTLNLTIIQSPFFGTLGLFLYIIPIIFWFAILFKQNKEGNLFFNFLILLSLFIILNTISYYLYGVTKLTSLIIIILPLLTFLLPPKEIEKQFNFNFREKITFKLRHFSIIFLFLGIDIFLIITLILNRSTNLMPSPWQAVEYWFFILYALATGLLFFLLYTRNSTKERVLLSSLHLLLTFIITSILYPLGYGFDAFVHRATETWILNNGFINPKQPYYIGQYSLIVWLKHITNIPLFYIDIYLVPILASLTIPASIIYSLKHSFNTTTKYTAYSVWLIPFIPFLSLHLTTPYNLALLFSILIVFFAFAYLHGKFNPLILLLLAIATICTHPLIGMPMFVFTIAVFLLKKYQLNKLAFSSILLFSLIALTISLPLMFIINNIRAGTGMPEFTNPILSINKFIALFARPYWYAKNTPIIYELLYIWQSLIVPFTIITGIIGFILYQKKYTNKLLYLFPISIFGFIISAWLLRSWVIFPDIVSYEQGDFPLRLIKASILFFLPFIGYFLYSIIKLAKNHKFKKIFLIKILILSSILLMISLYLSYPQRNIKARFPGLNVTDNDFKAVEWIHNRHNQYDYIVLSNQLVSAAALTNYSFAKYFSSPYGEIFYYSVPTGGLLYKQYGKMLYEGQKREYMIEAMNLVNVKKSYFIVNSYWANADKIIEGAKKTANAWLIIDGGKVWIFEYSN